MPTGETGQRPPSRPGRNGGKLKTGNPGNKGGTGRPPDEFKGALARLASRGSTMRALSAILRDPKHPHFITALKFSSERGYGKEPLPMRLGPDDSGKELVVRFVRE